MSYNGDLNAVNTAPLSSPSIQSREEIEGGATELLMGGELELLIVLRMISTCQELNFSVGRHGVVMNCSKIIYHSEWN